MKKTIIATLIIVAMILAFSFEANAKEDYHEYVNSVAAEYGVCPELIEAIILVESSGDQYAISDCNAKGYMQVREEMHQDLIEELGITDVYDAKSNIQLGTAILMEYASEFDDVYVALAAYNYGENSQQVKDAQKGIPNRYSDKVLQLSEKIERENGK